MHRTAALAAIAVVLAWPAPSGSSSGCHRPTAHDLQVRLPAEWPRFRRALMTSFRDSWRAAAVVSFGESSWDPDAANGEYRGLFQLGRRERARTHWTADVAGQVRAAALWNRLTGGRWSAWSCRP